MGSEIKKIYIQHLEKIVVGFEKGIGWRKKLLENSTNFQNFLSASIFRRFVLDQENLDGR